MNILINTLFYQNYNYGGILQAFALYHKLEELKYNVIELNYTRTYDDSIKRNLNRGFSLLKRVIHPQEFFAACKNHHVIHENVVKYNKMYPDDPIKSVFDKFMDDEFKSTRLYHPDTINKLPPFDAYIIGGDQMWNPLWFDENYFLKFAKGKKIAYSCSIGKDNLTYKEKKKLRYWISTLDYVSTRENNVYKWINNEGIDCKLIADPVFLLTADEWRQFSCNVDKKFLLKEPYIFAYLLGQDRNRRDAIKEFASKNRMRIVSIPHVWRRYNEFDDNFADYSFMNVGPKEFVMLISRASFVMTDSFHGTAFSIIFNKSFYNFSRFRNNDKNSLNSRLKSVLKEYELENRMIDVEAIPKLEIKEINYSEVNQIIKRKRETATRYIIESLR